MSIKQGDIKLVAAAVMDDVPEGGGAPTSHVINDNTSNEIFKDVSESDRARGRLNMSKVFVSVQSDDTDDYLGANLIVAKPADDPQVSITLFKSDQVFDTRADAQSRLESYMNKSAEWNGFLCENHIAGQSSIQIFQRLGSELPTTGKTLVLVQNEGLPNEREQYIRVTRVSAVERTFTYGTDQDFKAWIVSVELSSALRYDFSGTPANRQFTRGGNTAVLRDTTVVDAGNYAGVTKLSAPIAIGDFTLRAESVYTALVPSAQVESPIPSSPPYANSGIPKEGAQVVAFESAQAWTTTATLVLPGGCLPGSLEIDASGTLIRDKAGRLVVGEQEIGSIDYPNGLLTLLVGHFPGTKTLRYQPAAFVPAMPQSMDIRVTAEGRSQNYIGVLTPIPAIGTLSISYQVQGSWYTLSDTGDGTIRGLDTRFGAGTYNKNTGDYIVTLGELPDVGSSIVLQWGVPTQEYSHPAVDLKVSQTVVLPTSASNMLDPAYLHASWSVDGVAKTASANTAGALTGDATGLVDVRNANLLFSPNNLPPPGTQITFQYDSGPKSETTLTHPSRTITGTLLINAGATNLARGSVAIEWNTLTDMAVLGTYTRAQLDAMGIGSAAPVDPIQYARDDGVGNLRLIGGVRVGSVDYVSGDIEFVPDLNIRIAHPRYDAAMFVNRGDTEDTALYRLNYRGIDYIEAPSLFPDDDSGWVKIRFYSTLTSSRQTQTVEFKPSFDLIEGFSAPLVPGSVVLVPVVGTPWGDNGAGAMREPEGDHWIARGTIDYVTGMVSLSNWPVGISSTVRRASCVTTLGDNISSAYVFRTAAAPLRPGSMSIQFVGSSGLQVVTAAIDGTLMASGVRGSVDFQTGIVRLGFGDFVTAAGNEAEPWYDALRIGPDGKIFKPAPINAKTLKYTAVAFSYMPLNADLVGVDPVRLPSDGRVPIFRTGSMVVVGNTQTTGPLTPVVGQPVVLGRQRLSRAVVRQANGASVFTGYSVDLEAGSVTFTDLSGMQLPVTIEDRIEDMLVARDVQISGEMAFTRQITHNYSVDGTYVSSALEYGDRKARVSTVFDQATWDGVSWSDAPTSAVSVASYNTVLAPIEVTNVGASTERFALQFTSTTSFRIVGEHVGVIGTGDINTDCAPINPATGQPYFVVRALGWGVGWVPGNIVRINTVGALFPAWIVRTVQPGPEAGIDYTFEILTRGDVNRP